MARSSPARAAARVASKDGLPGDGPIPNKVDGSGARLEVPYTGQSVVWLVIKFTIAVGAALAIYLMGTAIVRGFMRVPPAQPDVRLLRRGHSPPPGTVGGAAGTTTATPPGGGGDAAPPSPGGVRIVVE